MMGKRLVKVFVRTVSVIFETALYNRKLGNDKKGNTQTRLVLIDPSRLTIHKLIRESLMLNISLECEYIFI